MKLYFTISPQVFKKNLWKVQILDDDLSLVSDGFANRFAFKLLVA